MCLGNVCAVRRGEQDPDQAQKGGKGGRGGGVWSGEERRGSWLLSSAAGPVI